MLLMLLEHKSVCLMNNKAKQYQTTGVWNREKFITELCKEMGGSRTPKLLKAFSKSFKKQKVKDGHG